MVGSGIKAQSSNPEVKVKVVDPVMNQIIDKLRHINQVSSCTFSKLSLETPPLSTMFVPLWLLSGPFMSQISGLQGLLTHGTAVMAACVLLQTPHMSAVGCPRWQAEGQVTGGPLDPVLAPLP